MAKTDLTAERVRELFDYNPANGILVAKITGNKRYAGSTIGTVSTNSCCGHKAIVLAVDGNNYLAHRVIWLLAYGEWPTHTIDHINGISTDNRLSNLRDVTQLENSRNKPLISSNTSGVTGVAWRESKGKWRAHITVMKKAIHLGYFKNKEDAISARLNALTELGFSKRHGLPI